MLLCCIRIATRNGTKMTYNKLSFDKYHWTGITTFLRNLSHDNNRNASKR